MRKKLIAGNHKMHTTLPEGMQLAKDLYAKLKDVADRVDVLLVPPFTHLFAVSGILKNTGFHTGAQNCASEPSGAYTGEVSASMLASAGASHVLVGHSERRQWFGEDHPVLVKKIREALHNGLHVIYCFGETLGQREAGEDRYLQVLRAQLETVREAMEHPAGRLTLAYEPVWAIGTGRTATPEQAQAVHAFARAWVHEAFPQSPAHADIRIIYGGSVNPENAAALLSQADIDGALVGGASLGADSFSAIVHAAL